MKIVSISHHNKSEFRWLLLFDGLEASLSLIVLLLTFVK